MSLVSDDGPTPQTTPITSITFSKGTITDCNINFVGETGDQGSTVIDIVPQNPITGSFCLYLAYSDYNASETTIIDNGFPQCTISVNGNPYSAQAVQSERIAQEFKCLFNENLVIANGTNLQINLSGTVNPFTTENYGTFTLITSDSIYEYDQASNCNLGVVSLKQYVGTFSTSPTVNSISSNPIITTTLSVPTSINTGNSDSIVLTRPGILFSNYDSLSIFRNSVISLTKQS